MVPSNRCEGSSGNVKPYADGLGNGLLEQTKVIQKLAKLYIIATRCIARFINSQ